MIIEKKKPTLSFRGRRQGGKPIPLEPYEKLMTNKFECKRCKQARMYPNHDENKIKGYVCKNCGEINYPVKDALKKKVWTYA